MSAFGGKVRDGYLESIDEIPEPLRTSAGLCRMSVNDPKRTRVRESFMETRLCRDAAEYVHGCAVRQSFKVARAGVKVPLG